MSEYTTWRSSTHSPIPPEHHGRRNLQSGRRVQVSLVVFLAFLGFGGCSLVLWCLSASCCGSWSSFLVRDFVSFCSVDLSGALLRSLRSVCLAFSWSLRVFWMCFASARLTSVWCRTCLSGLLLSPDGAFRIQEGPWSLLVLFPPLFAEFFGHFFFFTSHDFRDPLVVVGGGFSWSVLAPQRFWDVSCVVLLSS